MRVILTKRMLPLVIQAATPAEVAELARDLARGGSAAGMAPETARKAVCYAPTFGLTPAGEQAVQRRRQRPDLRTAATAAQPELPMEQEDGRGADSTPMTPGRVADPVLSSQTAPPAAKKEPVAVPPSGDRGRRTRPLPTASAAAARRTTGHGGQATHPPAPAALVQLMRLLESRYTVNEIAARVGRDRAQIVRMSAGRRGTSPKTLLCLLALGKFAEPRVLMPAELVAECWRQTRARAHNLPKAWRDAGLESLDSALETAKREIDRKPTGGQ